jgi:hypothetical protein
MYCGRDLLSVISSLRNPKRSLIVELDRLALKTRAPARSWLNPKKRKPRSGKRGFQISRSLGSRGEIKATDLRITYRAPVSGILRRNRIWFRSLRQNLGQRFAVCGHNPAGNCRDDDGRRRRQAPPRGSRPCGMYLSTASGSSRGRYTAETRAPLITARHSACPSCRRH